METPVSSLRRKETFQKEMKTFALVELQDQIFRCILSSWININDDMNDGDLKCMLPSTVENKIFKAIHEHKKPDSSWIECNIIEVHRYADDMQEAKSLLNFLKSGVPLDDRSLNTIIKDTKKSRHERAKKKISDSFETVKTKSKSNKNECGIVKSPMIKEIINISPILSRSRFNLKEKRNNILSDLNASINSEYDMRQACDFDAQNSTLLESDIGQEEHNESIDDKEKQMEMKNEKQKQKQKEDEKKKEKEKRKMEKQEREKEKQKQREKQIEEEKQKQTEKQIHEAKQKEKELKSQKEKEIEKNKGLEKHREKKRRNEEQNENLKMKKKRTNEDLENQEIISFGSTNVSQNDNKLLKKLEKVIMYQCDTLDRLDVIEEIIPKFQGKEKVDDKLDDEEFDIEMNDIFPIKTKEELDQLERKLDSKIEQKKMRKYFQSIGATNPMLLTNNILKKILNLDVAALYSYKGKTKLNFSNLKLCRCIIRILML